MLRVNRLRQISIFRFGPMRFYFVSGSRLSAPSATMPNALCLPTCPNSSYAGRQKNCNLQKRPFTLLRLFRA